MDTNEGGGRGKKLSTSNFLQKLFTISVSQSHISDFGQDSDQKRFFTKVKNVAKLIKML